MIKSTVFGNTLPAAADNVRLDSIIWIILTILIILLAPTVLTAQAPDDAPMRELVARLDRGETEAVRRELPEYVAKYQNHPGLLYVQARVATDGIEAAKLYQSVIDNYPASEWADDALFNLYQYYYAMGLYKTAELKMQQLTREYPQSEHLTGRTPVPSAAPGTVTTGAAASGGAGVKTVLPPSAQPPTAAPAGTAPAAVDSVAAPNRAKDENAAAVTGGAATQATQATKETASGQTTEPVASPSGTEPYTLQVGAFSTSENARKQKAFFEERGYVAEITNRVRSGKSLFLVWVGSYANADEARKTLREIQSRYTITPIVVER